MLYVVVIPVAMIMVFSDFGIYLREAVIFYNHAVCCSYTCGHDNGF